MVSALLAVLAGMHSYGEHFLRNSKSFMRQEMNTALQKVQKTSTEVSFASLFKETDGKKYVSFFSCIIIFYVCWNLLANTFGQFRLISWLRQMHHSHLQRDVESY